MNDRLRKSIAALVASLTKEGVTESELDSMISDLAKGGELSRRIGAIVSNEYYNRPDNRAGKLTSNSDEHTLKDFITRCKRLKITQKMLMAIFNKISPTDALKLRGKRLSTERLVERFIDGDPYRLDSIVRHIINTGIYENNDSYLDLIGERLKK